MSERRRRPTREETRLALLAAAARVFVERGFGAASVESIAAEAGFTRGAFYSNFSSKEQLFVELLHQQVYSHYRAMVERRLADPDDQPDLRGTGEELAGMQGGPEGRWLLRLLLEVLAHAGRDDRARDLAAGIWSENRGLVAELNRRAYERVGQEPPADPELLATALIALDVGLSLQRYLEPEAVPLSAWPELYELLFGPTAPR